MPGDGPRPARDGQGHDDEGQGGAGAEHGEHLRWVLRIEGVHATVAPGLGREGARCRESARGVVAMHTQGLASALGLSGWGGADRGGSAVLALAVGVGRGRRPPWAGPGGRQSRDLLGALAPRRSELAILFRPRPSLYTMPGGYTLIVNPAAVLRAGPRSILAGVRASNRLHPARLSRIERHVRTPDNAVRVPPRFLRKYTLSPPPNDGVHAPKMALLKPGLQ